MAKRGKKAETAQEPVVLRAVVSPDDLRLVEQARERVREGKKPTALQASAIRRVEKANDENERWRHYLAIPLAHWCEMAGRQHKTVYEQAERLGFPMLLQGCKTVNLPAFVRRFHDFLADNARRFGTNSDDADMVGPGVNSPALERYRAANASIRELELEERRRQLVSRQHVHSGFAKLAATLRQAGEELKRQFGNDAHEILDDALVEAAEHIEDLLGEKVAENDASE